MRQEPWRHFRIPLGQARFDGMQIFLDLPDSLLVSWVMASCLRDKVSRLVHCRAQYLPTCEGRGAYRLEANLRLDTAFHPSLARGFSGL